MDKFDAFFHVGGLYPMIVFAHKNTYYCPNISNLISLRHVEIGESSQEQNEFVTNTIPR